MKYALDIETCTDNVNGLDPRESHITSVAIFNGTDGVVFDGDERQLLIDLETYVATLDKGVIVTWNGAAFDIPWLAYRFKKHGLTTTLQAKLSDMRIPSYTPMHVKFDFANLRSIDNEYLEAIERSKRK